MGAVRNLNVAFDEKDFSAVQVLRRKDKEGRQETWKQALLRLAKEAK